MDLNKFARRSVELSRLNMDGPARSHSSSRRSFSRNRREEKRASEKQDSSDSYVHSLEDPGSSAVAQSASDETQGSASQILRGSEVLFSPTIQRSASATRRTDAERAGATLADSRLPGRHASLRDSSPRNLNMQIRRVQLKDQMLVKLNLNIRRRPCKVSSRQAHIHCSVLQVLQVI